MNTVSRPTSQVPGFKTLRSGICNLKLGTCNAWHIHVSPAAPQNNGAAQKATRCAYRTNLTRYRLLNKISKPYAEVAELADALGSGSSGLMLVGVRLPPSAPAFAKASAGLSAEASAKAEVLAGAARRSSPERSEGGINATGK